MNSKVIKIPATSANVGPGFDCLGLALNLYNEISFEKTMTPGEVSITIAGEGKRELDRDDQNLVYRAFKKTFEYCKEEVPGIQFTQVNRIPLSRGLGSSSAAIIGGIVMANELLDQRLSNQEILTIATAIEGHPDNVAPALLGGFVISFSEKNEVFAKKIKVPQSINASVIVPNFELSTSSSRGILPEMVSMADAVHNISRASLLVSSLITEDYDNLKRSFSDKLHQSYRSSLIPGLSEVITEAEKHDIIGIALSGAGPSIIIFHNESDRVPFEVLIKILEKNNVFSEIYHLQPVVNGTIVK